MLSTANRPPRLWRFSLVVQSFLTEPGLPFAAALSEERIEQAFADEAGAGKRGQAGKRGHHSFQAKSISDVPFSIPCSGRRRLGTPWPRRDRGDVRQKVDNLRKEKGTLFVSGQGREKGTSFVSGQEY